ncbi:MAG: ATP-binding cassette domain-containing protein, partial [Actinobacteria bacterium]|nr:ATP-binding cassette domain-containing protein [Actinomycetota bacterium]
MNVLEVSGLTKYYGDSVALDNAGISVGAGVIHAIVGENGAGKSTMVKVLSGMVTPDSGEVKIDGTVLELGVPKVSRSAGVFTAFQELSLLPNLTVAENLLIAELPTRSGVVSRRAVQGQAAKILKEWGVDDLDPGL